MSKANHCGSPPNRAMSDLDPIKDAKHRLRRGEHSGKSGISDLQNNARIIDGVDGPALTASTCQGVMKEFIIIGGVAVKHRLL